MPVHVEGWNEQAYTAPDVQRPNGAASDARAFVTAFDSLVWERARVQRLFGMQYTISLYTPADKRVHGYYVCPFLLGDALVARCDLKADRQRSVLVVQSAFLEPGQVARRVAPEMKKELRELQRWLELDKLQIVERGDLACSLR